MIERFLCVGSLNVDVTFQLSRMPEEHEKLRCPDSAMTSGGSAANTAYWLARFGAETQMLGCVGEDAFGDFCFINQSDLFRTFGSIPPREAWTRLGCGLAMVLTCGKEGASLVSEHGEYFVAAFPAEVVDRTGGGDAFDEGFLYALSKGFDWESCLRLGLFLASRVIAGIGARPKTFDLKEFQALAEEQ